MSNTKKTRIFGFDDFQMQDFRLLKVYYFKLSIKFLMKSNLKKFLSKNVSVKVKKRPKIRITGTPVFLGFLWPVSRKS
jgi:hypothetical protein